VATDTASEWVGRRSKTGGGGGEGEGRGRGKGRVREGGTLGGGGAERRGGRRNFLQVPGLETGSNRIVSVLQKPKSREEERKRERLEGGDGGVSGFSSS
jgi:hypothetical protein